MVSRALLDGEPVALEAEVAWPLPPPLPVAPQGQYTIRVTDRDVPPGEREVLPRPPSLVDRGRRVEGGAGRGDPRPGRGALREAGLSPKSVAELATVDAKAQEPGIVAAAERLGGARGGGYSAAGTGGRRGLPNPSQAPLAAVGTPSVAEAAALLQRR